MFITNIVALLTLQLGAAPALFKCINVAAT